MLAGKELCADVVSTLRLSHRIFVEFAIGPSRTFDEGCAIEALRFS